MRTWFPILPSAGIQLSGLTRLIWTVGVGVASIWLSSPTVTCASQGDLYQEYMLVGGYSEKDQWIGGNGRGIKNAVGLEYFRKFSDEQGDYMTLDVQTRLAYDSQQSRSDAFGIEVHNAWLDLHTGLGRAIRVGHFSPAFGLEPLLDTHSSLLQTLAKKNVGFKQDWGVGYRGFLGDFDYQLAAQLGSGMSIITDDGAHLLSARIGTPMSQPTQVGVSLLYGRTLQSLESWTIPKPVLRSHQSTLKKRVGIDCQFPWWLLDCKAEVVLGEEEDNTVGGAMGQIEYTLPEHQETKLQLQVMYWSSDLDQRDSRDLTLLPAIEHRFSEKTTLRFGTYLDIHARQGRNNTAVLQLYYFGT